MTDSNNSKDRFLSFSLGEEEYAIPLLTVREVIGMPDITPVPQTPSHFLGIMNLRGQIISVIDLRKKLAIKSTGGAETGVVISDIGGISIGLVVDSIRSVLAAASSEIADPPQLENNPAKEYVRGVYRREKKLVLFLDIGCVLGADIAHATNAAKAA